MLHKKLSLLLACLFPLALLAQPKLKFVDFATGFSRPVDIAQCGDSRLFIVEQAGKIWVLDSLGVRQTAVFLDINDRVINTGNERGLLGLAFHPNYAQNGWFFVNYVKNDGHTRIARFTRSTADPTIADPGSELTILEQNQPFSNHKGGCVKFGPDGYLYIGLGDGGSGGDPQGNGQKKSTLLGKMLRIDVHNSSTTTPYVVPADNPFVGNTAYKPEIWALGLRNPWRFSFDRLNGDLWIADVGQNAREEIDHQPAGVGGRNYGWNCYEGNSPFETAGCQPANTYAGPAFEYVNPSIGCSVTGGFVYRGSKYPEVYGKYLLTDYCSGRWWAVAPNANGTFTGKEIANLADNEYSSLGEDVYGELYVAALASGKILKITELCSGFNFAGTVSGAVCDSSFAGSIVLEVTGGAPPVTYKWSNGATEKDIVYLNPGTYAVTVKDGNSCERRDTFELLSLSPVPDPIFQGGDTLRTLNFAPDLTLQWYFEGNPIPGANDHLYVPTQTGYYSLLVSNAEGCQTFTDPVFFDFSSATLPASVARFMLAPNPTSDQTMLTLELRRGGNTTIFLTDGQGRTIFSQTHQEQKIALPIDLRGLPAGTYFLNVQTEHGAFVRQLLKR